MNLVDESWTIKWIILNDEKCTLETLHTHTHCKKWCKNLKCKKIQCKKEDNKNVSNLNDTQFVSELVKQHFYWWSLSNKSSTRFDKIKIFNKLFNRQRDVSASCWTIHSRVLNFLYTLYVVYDYTQFNGTLNGRANSLCIHNRTGR